MRPKYLRKKCKGEKEAIEEVFDEQVYDPSWFDFNQKNIKIIVDIGALIGSFTLWAQEQWPDAKIYAFEPDKESYDYLLKNIKEVNSKKKIFAFNEAIWGTDEELDFHRFEITPGNNSVLYHNRPFVEGSEKIVKITPKKMLDVMKQVGGKIDLLKIDCEGAEYNILYSL